MSSADLPFSSRTTDIFPTKVWVANFSSIEGDRDQLVADVLELLTSDAEGTVSPLETEMVLQDRTEPHWVRLIAMISAFTDSLALELRPGWRDRSIHCWGRVRHSPNDVAEPVEPHTAYQAATYSGILWLQLPDAIRSEVSMVLRDPLFHLHERLGWECYADVVPNELRLFMFPGYLERFSRPLEVRAGWESPAVALVVDAFYY